MRVADYIPRYVGNLSMRMRKSFYSESIKNPLILLVNQQFHDMIRSDPMWVA